MDAGLVRGIRRASLGPALGLLLAAGPSLWSHPLSLGLVVVTVVVSVVNLNLFQHRVGQAEGHRRSKFDAGALRRTLVDIHAREARILTLLDMVAGREMPERAAQAGDPAECP